MTGNTANAGGPMPGILTAVTAGFPGPGFALPSSGAEDRSGGNLAAAEKLRETLKDAT